MHRFRDRPIRHKVAILILVASAFGLGLVGAAVTAYELTTFRPRVLRDVVTQADVIRVNTIPALLFEDSTAAAENLQSLEARPEIGAAAIYRADTSVFVTYQRRADAPPLRPESFAVAHRFGPGFVQVVERLESDGRLAGWLTLRYDLPPLWRRIAQYGIMAAAVVLALAAAAALLLRLLSREVSGPLLDLAGAARSISATGDTSLRVPRGAADEIGTLTDAFNQMLSRLQDHQQALQDSETRLRVALEAAEMETIVLDVPAGGGMAPALRSLLERAHPDDREAIRAAVIRSGGDARGFEIEFRAAPEPAADNGHAPQDRWLALHGQVQDGPAGARVTGVLRDTTERRRIEAELIQAQKMDAIGNLAGGIAHDFNNLLTGMLGYLAFAARAVPAGSRLQLDIQQVEQAARRAATLTSQLLAYSRRQMVMPTPVNVNDSVVALEPLMRRILGEDIQVVTALAAAPWTTRIDAGQLEQVILNLAVNAREAMPHGGRLEIATRNVLLAESPEPGPAGAARPGAYIAIDVTDTGVGMDAATRTRIFEPFFTTKPPGQGTGLGLAMCFGIVTQAGGTIGVESEPGNGSRFTILLPRITGGATDGVQGAATEAAPVSGHATVLLVEDDATVRQFARRALEEAGYTVMVADGGRAALARAGDFAGRIDALVTDVVMPEVGGREVAEELTRRRPGLPVLFISGYTADALTPRGGLPPGARLLAKPFSPEALATAVSRALGR